MNVVHCNVFRWNVAGGDVLLASENHVLTVRLKHTLYAFGIQVKNKIA